MKHGKKFNHLSRKAAHRKAMLANMACSLIKHKRIRTTLAKAKALRVYVEPLITKSKNDTTHSRRTVFSYLKQKEVITELFADIASRVAERPGGYTRILKLGNRLGDNAQMAYIELVDYNEVYVTDKPKRKKSRRTKKKNIDPSSIQVMKEEVTEEENVEASLEEVKEAASAKEVKEAAPVEQLKKETSVEEEDEEAPVEQVKEAAPVKEVKAAASDSDDESIEFKNPEGKQDKGE